MSSFQFNRGQA